MRNSVIAAAVYFSLGVLTAAADVEAAIRRPTSIAAQGLGPALQALTRERNLQLVYRSEIVDDRQSSGASGELTPIEALTQVLRGTGLTFQRLDEKTLTIVPLDENASAPQSAPQNSIGSPATPKAAPQPETDASKKKQARAGIWDRLRLAQAGDENRPSSDATAQPIQLEEVVVTGTNIRGTRDVAAPSMTLTRESIERTGHSTVEAVFEDLPQNFAGVSADGAFAAEGGSRLAQRNEVDRVTAIDLRGLGPESTLTLVNGTRRAGSVDGRIVDISAIPLSIIERVEIVSGGRSAIYGSDAVAGVVNLVTRRSFEGAESQVSYGIPTGNTGGERFQLSQIAGTEIGRGGIVGAYDYQRDSALDLMDTGLIMSPDASGSRPTRIDVVPDTVRHSAFLSGHWDATDRLALRGDALYTHKKFEGSVNEIYPNAGNESTSYTGQTSKHSSVSLGAKAGLGAQWELDVSGTMSAVDNSFANDSVYVVSSGSYPYSQRWLRESTLSSVSAVVDGPLFALGAMTPRAAFGAESRRESFQFLVDGADFFDADRRINSMFGELLFPVVEDGAHAGLRRFELSVAGRYDDYEDVGSTFNPQLGLIWGVTSQLTVRGAYSRAFRAPALFEQAPVTYAFLTMRSDPTTGNAVPMLELTGMSPDLSPEEARTWSLGLDYQLAPAVKLSLSYFEIDYEDRVDSPASSLTERELVLERAERYQNLIVRSPSVAQTAAFLASDIDGFLDIDSNVTTSFDPNTQDLLSVFPDLVLFDDRASNIATERVRGMDFSFDAAMETMFGSLLFGLNATYTLEHQRNVTPTSPSFGLMNEVGKPVDFRFRANAGWMRNAYGAFVYLNYLDDYANPFSASTPTLESWTTVDLTLRFDGTQLAARGWLDGFSATLALSNVFDADPPEFIGSREGLRYDAANASPVGRTVSLRLVKRW